MDDPNRLHHIFGEPIHNLEPLVLRYGGEEAAFQTIKNAVNTAFDGGHLMIDDNGLYKQVFDIGGNSVTVSGRVINDEVYISTAWIPPEGHN